MKITISKSDKKKIDLLFQSKIINMSLAEMFNFLYTTDEDFYPVKNKEEYIAQILEKLEIDSENPEDKEIVKKAIIPCFSQQNPNIILENPFFKTIKVPQVSHGEYEYTYDTYKAYHPFPNNDIKVDLLNYFLEINDIGYFSQDVTYPVLLKNNVIWMLITPNEINTMQESIDKAHGDVLVGGLGMGYYAFMISNKEEVSSITIVENDVTIIKFFKEYLLPQFPNKDKIHIVQDDVLNYLKKSHKHDFAFIDLWHNPNDGIELYIKCKRLEYLNKNCEYTYWLEESILSLYRRCLLTVIEESLMGYDDKNYQKINDPLDKIINDIYFKTKKNIIINYDDIFKLLTNESIKDLILR